MHIAPRPPWDASRRKLLLPFADVHPAVHVQHLAGYALAIHHASENWHREGAQEGSEGQRE